MKKLKVLRGQKSLAIYLATLQHKPGGDIYVAGYLPQHKMPAKERFISSPSYAVFRTDPKDKTKSLCVRPIETAHGYIEVWEIDAGECLKESEAEAAFMQHLKESENPAN